MVNRREAASRRLFSHVNLHYFKAFPGIQGRAGPKALPDHLKFLKETTIHTYDLTVI
jgi:hypothetical protein